jgi:hypothetical protein
MDISTKRFHIKSTEFSFLFVRDMNAPYHLYQISNDKIPSVYELAMMTEEQFDRLLERLVY